MSKFLGSVELYDLDSLEEIASSIGYTTDPESDNNNCISANAVWDEAKTYMDQNSTNEAEVRISGLDYVEVYDYN